MDKSPFTADVFERIAREELNETPEQKEKAINELQALLSEETKLNFPIEDEDFMLRFLRVAKFDPRKAFDRICKYFKNCQKYWNDWQNLKLSPEMIECICQDIAYIVNSDKCKDGSTLLYIWVEKWDVSKYPSDLIFQMFWLALEFVLIQKDNQIAGATVIFDVKGMKFEHFSNFTQIAVKLAKTLTASVPIRLKGIHIINSNRFARLIYTLMSPAIPKKIRNRVFFYGNEFETMFDLIGVNVVPEVLGGKCKLVSNKNFLEDYKNSYPKIEPILSYGYYN